jgi:hypothetical protein
MPVSSSTPDDRMPGWVRIWEVLVADPGRMMFRLAESVPGRIGQADRGGPRRA